MKEQPIVIYDMFPERIFEKIKLGNPMKLIDIAKKGMVIDFISSSEEDLIGLREDIVRILDSNGTLIIDIDELEHEYEKMCRFLVETKKVHIGFVIWLFRVVFHLSDVFSKDKQSELYDADKGLGQNRFCWASRTYEFTNEETSEKRKLFHGVLSTHEYLVSRPYLDSLFDKQEKRFQDMFSKKGKKKTQNRNPIGPKLRHEVFKRDKYSCVECGINKEKTSLHVDHIIPISRGGTDELDNLQTLCYKCNLVKSDKIYEVKKNVE